MGEAGREAQGIEGMWAIVNRLNAESWPFEKAGWRHLTCSEANEQPSPQVRGTGPKAGMSLDLEYSQLFKVRIFVLFFVVVIFSPRQVPR